MKITAIQNISFGNSQNNKKPCFIMDIDGVYTDSKKWENQSPKISTREGWDNHHRQVSLSKPNKEMVDIAKSLQKLLPIIFITSREDYGHMRDFTKHEIETYSNDEILIGERNKLLMRKSGDFRPSPQVKQELLNEVKKEGYEPILAIDDSQNNLDMFDKNHIATKLYIIG